MDGSNIRPFHVNFPEDGLVDLRQRIAAKRWLEKETVTDASQGVQLATMRQLALYWQKEYDWRKFDARLNGFPQYMTEIDGLDIHFIHVRSQYENALPHIVTHGWAGSIIEQLKIIDPLANPTAHGGSASDAFDVVVPSLPLYAIANSPVGLAAWMIDHDARSEALISRAFNGQSEGLSRDDVLDNVTMYWLTNTAVSAARSYWDYSATAKKGFIITRFPKADISRTWF